MIYSALKLVRNELNHYLQQGSSANLVHLENIATLDDNNGSNHPRGVIMSMVNMAEETALKNQKSYISRGNSSVLENPPVYLNLHVLFAVNLNDYETCLQRLSQVVTFFQGKNHFTQHNSPDPDGVFADGSSFRLIMELGSLGIEELSNLWGMLGGNQYPAALYRMRLVELKGEQIQGTTGVIQSVQLDRNTDGGTP